MTPRENPILLGQTAAEAEFIDALCSGRMHHAWLITGPAGIGKATLAFRFVRALLAGQTTSLALDPAHAVFRRVAMGSHADLLTIEREWDDKRARLRGEIVVDDTRAVSSFLRLTPAEGGWRAVVIDGAEHMNRNAANAVLKMLEEPPARAILLLTCAAPGRLLPTIRSRCRRLALQPLGEPDMHAVLEGAQPDMAAADRARLIAIAGGSPGRAMLLAEQRGLQLAALAAEVLGQVPAVPKLRAFDIADTLGGRGQDDFTPFMTLLCSGLADIVRSAARGQPERLLTVRPLVEWAELWQSLSRILDDTERLNLDRRQALLASITMLNGS